MSIIMNIIILVTFESIQKILSLLAHRQRKVNVNFQCSYIRVINITASTQIFDGKFKIVLLLYNNNIITVSAQIFEGKCKLFAAIIYIRVIIITAGTQIFEDNLQKIVAII